MSTKFRPKEIQAWIKSKKKTDVPSIDPERYGTEYMAWWKGMQPEWRRYMDTDTSSNGTLKRDTPADEDWSGLKKGGTAGMYIIVMALSWWVKAQTAGPDHSNDAWSAVSDLSWVFHEINKNHSPGPRNAKRVHDDDEEDSKAKKKCVIPCVTVNTNIDSHYFC